MAKRTTPEPELDTDIDTDDAEFDQAPADEPDLEFDTTDTRTEAERIIDDISADDDVSDVPDEFLFSTTQTVDEDDEDPLDKPLPIVLDGQKVFITRPSDSAIALRISQIVNAGDDSQRLLAMIGLLEAALDPVTTNHIKSKMLLKPRKGERFSDELIGRLCEIIIQKWGNTRQAEKLATATRAPANRKEKRLAGRSK